MKSALETSGLTKRYGATIAVADLNLRVEPGQVFGFLGPNGAGKSTTIRMLLALQRPTRGRVRLLGFDAAADSIEVHRRVGYLPGDLQLFPRLTGQQHIAWFVMPAASTTTRWQGSWSTGARSWSIVRCASCPRATGRRSAWCWPSCTGRSCWCSTSRPLGSIRWCSTSSRTCSGNGG
jgi:hypothetical protein